MSKHLLYLQNPPLVQPKDFAENAGRLQKQGNSHLPMHETRFRVRSQQHQLVLCFQPQDLDYFRNQTWNSKQ